MKLRTAVTLLVLLAVLLGGAYYGWQALTGPVADTTATDTTTPAAKKPCPKDDDKAMTVLTSRDVQVSVYNASSIDGLAGSTMASLHDRGFRTGTVGNAPSSARVLTVAVRSTKPKSPEARLVARQFGVKPTKISRRSDLGPGIDVFVGSGFSKLSPMSRATLSIKAPVDTPKRCRKSTAKS